ncbi:antitoxin component YwqK of YwqJK toxin-antitoxin module [Pedobacter sp. CAN_A7]|uniref:energy transducer TonB n=1 Tax=Pedobacter sp. CAN_A7 TaxID=2787722 RepID=UPI0018C9DE32
MKYFVFLLFSSLLFVGLHVSAQKKNVYLLKNNGDYVKNADSADFIRSVEEPEKGSNLYPTKEFYMNGTRKSYGYSSKIDPPLYEGTFLSFFENGKKKQYKNYVKGKIIDTAFNYFPNGKVYSTLLYKPSGDSSIVYVKGVNDSTGAAMVTDGNGYAVLYDEDFKYITGKGNVKNGKYDGEWTGELRTKDTLHYKEVYAEGKMISGTSNDGKGNVYHYTTSDVKPNFKGGMKLFYRQVLQGFRSRELVRQRIQGVAQVNFVILTSGEISDVHVINDVHTALASEAIRVIKAQKGWQPARQKGRAVKMMQTFPISLNISN